MQPCSRCHEDNLDQRRFCRACGAALAHPCTQCGFGNGSGDKFCGGCGRDLLARETDPDTGLEEAAVAQADPGISQLLDEVAADQSKEGDTKTSFDQNELEDLFGDDFGEGFDDSADPETDTP